MAFDFVAILVMTVIWVLVVRYVVSKTRRRAHRFRRRWYPSGRDRVPAVRQRRQVSPATGPLEDRSVVTKELALSVAEVKAQFDNLPKYGVVQVIDGDTVIVSNTWAEKRVRLDAIDCPEDGQHWGDTARYGLIKLIGGKEVRLEEHGQDHYGRTLGTLYVRRDADAEWMNVNERMVTLGHAWVMRQFYDHLPKDRQDRLNRLERWAKSKRVGLWKTANPIAPWRWRNGGGLSDPGAARDI